MLLGMAQATSHDQAAYLKHKCLLKIKRQRAILKQ
jgi:hypothetical protein